jgi:hypothetical protein
VNCTAVRVRAGVEFDIDIQHHWCWLKWWDSFYCSLLSAVEPCECPERAQACEENYSGHHSVPVMWFAVPPKQQEYSDVKPEGTPDKIAAEQMDKCLEPRCYCEAKGEPIEQRHGHQDYRDWPHFPVRYLARRAACAVRLTGARNSRL